MTQRTDRGCNSLYLHASACVSPIEARTLTCLPWQAVQVSVVDGWITLSGAVDWPYQQQAAADGIRHVVGARGMRDLIVVKPLGHKPSGA